MKNKSAFFVSLKKIEYVLSLFLQQNKCAQGAFFQELLLLSSQALMTRRSTTFHIQAVR